jgi:hypothetical protein
MDGRLEELGYQSIKLVLPVIVHLIVRERRIDKLTIIGASEVLAPFLLSPIDAC